MINSKVACKACMWVFPVFLLMMSGCKKEFDPIKYMQKVEQDKRFCKRWSNDTYVLECYYRPAKYLALRELLKHHEGSVPFRVEEPVLNKAIKDYSNGLYFEVRISLVNGENIIVSGLTSQQAYATRVDYLNQSIYRDFHLLLDDLSKVRALGHSFQNTFGAGKSCDLTLVFPVNQSCHYSDFELVYEDRIFGMEVSKVRFAFKLEELLEDNNK